MLTGAINTRIHEGHKTARLDVAVSRHAACCTAAVTPLPTLEHPTQLLRTSTKQGILLHIYRRHKTLNHRTAPVRSDQRNSQIDTSGLPTTKMKEGVKHKPTRQNCPPGTLVVSLQTVKRYALNKREGSTRNNHVVSLEGVHSTRARKYGL